MTKVLKELFINMNGSSDKVGVLLSRHVVLCRIYLHSLIESICKNDWLNYLAVSIALIHDLYSSKEMAAK